MASLGHLESLPPLLMPTAFGRGAARLEAEGWYGQLHGFANEISRVALTSLKTECESVGLWSSTYGGILVTADQAGVQVAGATQGFIEDIGIILFGRRYDDASAYWLKRHGLLGGIPLVGGPLHALTRIVASVGTLGIRLLLTNLFFLTSALFAFPFLCLLTPCMGCSESQYTPYEEPLPTTPLDRFRRQVANDLILMPEMGASGWTRGLPPYEELSAENAALVNHQSLRERSSVERSINHDLERDTEMSDLNVDGQRFRVGTVKIQGKRFHMGNVGKGEFAQRLRTELEPRVGGIQAEHPAVIDEVLDILTQKSLSSFPGRPLLDTAPDVGLPRYHCRYGEYVEKLAGTDALVATQRNKTVTFSPRGITILIDVPLPIRIHTSALPPQLRAEAAPYMNRNSYVPLMTGKAQTRFKLRRGSDGKWHWTMSYRATNLQAMTRERSLFFTAGVGESQPATPASKSRSCRTCRG